MSQRKGDLYTFLFASAVCVACALILSLAATALKPQQVANVRHDIVMNLMATVGKDYNELAKLPKPEVFAMFDKEFDTLILDGNNKAADRTFMERELASIGYPEDELKALDTGSLMRRFNGKVGLLARKARTPRKEYDPGYKMVYIHREPGAGPDAYVIPIEGYGLWDLMKGYVALDLDLNTVKGISFYEHKETPGLGARVEEDWFKDNFKGKKILDERGNLVSITVAKGKAPESPHQVDGISGATLTGDGINEFLKSDLERYEPYFKTLRAKREASL